MAQPNADRNLLFGILALQLDFISRDQLVAAMNAWVLDKHQPLSQVLAEQQGLNAERQALLDALVREHLKQHGDDPEKSLAALSSIGSVRQSLEGVADIDLQTSLAHISAVPPQSADALGIAPPTQPPVATHQPGAAGPDASSAAWVGAPTSTGLRFRILRPHAKGGLGQVLVARDEELDREVALKEIQQWQADSAEYRDRFLREARITGGLEHPGIVPIYGLGAYPDGRPFYVMRFIKGDSLQERIDRFHMADKPGRDAGERSLELRGLLARFVAVCNAVAYAHSRGVIHRDLKPANVMLGPYGETLLVDWGLAKPLLQEEGTTAPPEGFFQPSVGAGVATQAGAIVGTPGYMAPEQAGGSGAGPAADVYGLGATLYHLLTGRAPFGGPDVREVLRRVVQGQYRPAREVNTSVPAALSAVCQKAMAREPADRYRTAKELAVEVERWLADEPVGAYREPWTRRARRWARRHRTPVTSLVVALLVAGLGLGVVLALQKAADRREAEVRQREAEARLAEADSYERQGITDRERGHKEDALAWFGKAREVLARIDLHDRRYRERVARVAYNVATLNRDTGKVEAAQKMYEECIEAYEALVAEDPSAGALLSDLAQAYSGLGVQQMQTGNFDAALASYDRAFSRQQQAVALAPGNVRTRLHLAALYNDRALTYERRGDFAAMEKDLQAAVEAIEEARGRLADTRDTGLDRTVRHHLARAHENLGNLYAGQKQYKRAVGEYARAKGLADALCQEEPGTLDYEMIVAKCGVNTGMVHLLNSEVSQGEEALSPAHDLLRRLVRRYPRDAEVQLALAFCLQNLGTILVHRLVTGGLPEAEHTKLAERTEGYLQEAGRILQTLASGSKDADQVAIGLASNYIGLGMSRYQRRQWPEALAWFDRAIARLQDLTRDGRDTPVVADKLIRALGMRALVLYRMDRLAQALDDVNLVLKRGGDPVAFGLLRAAVLARSGAHDEGVTAVQRLLDSVPKPPKPEVLYDAGCVFAVALEGLTRDTKLTESQKKEKARAYATRSVELLRQAVKAGYKKIDKIRDPGPAGDRDLDPLRGRDEFKQFLAELP
jgi:serine/threonine-protein kinase